MTNKNKPFEAEKTFGLGVLLKLTKKNLDGIDISTTGNKFTSSLSREEVNNAVSRIMQTHNIRLKVK
jgi:cytidylate kinase